jgi:hypothetical protein
MCRFFGLLAKHTLDVFWVVVCLPKFNSTYDREHHVPQLRVIENLCCARHRLVILHKPVNGPSQPLQVVVCSGSDFVGDVTDCKSYGGYVAYLDGYICVLELEQAKECCWMLC